MIGGMGALGRVLGFIREKPALLAGFLLGLLVIPQVLAGSFSNLRVDHIRTPTGLVEGYFPVRVEVANEQSNTAEDIHVRSWLPTFSNRAHGQINEITGFNKGRWLLQDVPSSTQAGEYWVRVTVSNDDERRVKHRLVSLGEQRQAGSSPSFSSSEGLFINFRTDREGTLVLTKLPVAKN